MATPCTTTASSERPFSLRKAWSWAVFDAANSAFPLIMTTAVFVLYFKGVVVGEGREGYGDMLWGYAVSGSAALVALTSPFVGAIADSTGRRKLLLLGYTIVAIVATLALGRSGPGTIVWAILFFAIANAAFEGGMVLYGSLLPFVVPRDRADKWSGIGWASGYIGGLLCLLLVLPYAKAGNIGIVTLIVAVWFAVFSLPLFTQIPEPKARGGNTGNPLRSLLETLRLAWRVKGMRHFMIAYFLYNDAIITVFTFAAPFATDELGFTAVEVFGMVAAVQLTGALGAWLFGNLAQRIGNLPTIRITLVIWLAVTISAFVIAIDAPFWDADTEASRATAIAETNRRFDDVRAEGAQAITVVTAAVTHAVDTATLTHSTPPSPLRKKLFFALGMLVGMAMGAAQAASRAFLASVVPESMSSRFFGLYAVAGRFSAIIGPALFGMISYATGSKAWSVLALATFFTAGLFMLRGLSTPEIRHNLDAEATGS